MTDGPPASGAFPQAPAAPSLIGQILADRYRILKLIGEGGMGEVYAAEHVHIEKKFAIKLLKSEIVSNPEAVTRFRQEARSSSSIGHRNIIAIDDFGQLPDGRIFMCMELLNGAALNDMIQHPMGADRLLNILIQTGHGLAAAHAKNIIHRDMKPENIFVTIGPAGEDIPKILDFGIAKVSGNDGGNHLTRTGTIFGTPFYMAPEQALGNPVDARTDIYAMGVIMYECFAGSLPFQGESFMGILTQHITTEPEPVAQRAGKAGRGLPHGLAEVITRCMRKNPNERYNTMDELVTDLVAIYRGIAGPGMSTYMEAFPVGSAQHLAQPTPAPMQRNAYSAPSAPTIAAGRQDTGPSPIAQANHPSQPNLMAPPSGPVAYYDQGAPLQQPYIAPPQPKKSSMGLIIAIVAVLAVGGAIAAFVILGNKKPTTTNGGGSGSQVAIETGSDHGVTPGSDHTVVVTPPDAATPASGSNQITTPGSNAVDPGSGAGSALTPVTPQIEVIVEANAGGAEVFEQGVKVGDVPMIAKITPGTPRTFVIKAKNYRDKTVVVDGKLPKQMARLDRIPGVIIHNQGSGAVHNQGSGATQVTPPPRMDCSQRVVDPRDKGCQKQYCSSHSGDPACAIMD
jgi:serine/threonine protein kinase